MPPELAVLMTAYNAEKTICKAVESLRRDPEPFDLLIVDDCSRIPVAEIIGPTDAKIQIIRPQKNLGVAGAKNFGLKRLLAENYEFLAMMDADDVCLGQRLAKQVAFLKANPQVAVVGAWTRFVDEATREAVFDFRPPCDADGIRNALYLNNCIMHSSWMIRTQVLRGSGLYSDDYPAAEDYELLRRMSARFEFANLPEFLLEYSISMSGVSMQKRRRQLFDRLRIQLRYFDPWRWAAWLGVARTILLFAVPLKLLAAYRAEHNLRLQYS